MRTAPALSVIIPTHNRVAFLRDAVASVQAQSLVDWELIVVDDASEDSTWDWLQSLDDPRIHPIRMAQPRERSAARNEGLRAASAEYVLFLDDDDRLLERALTHLFEALRCQPAAVGAVGATIFGSDSGFWKRSNHPRHRVLRSVWSDLLFGWVPLQGQALLRRRTVVEAGGWNEAMSLAEDAEIWLRLARLGPAVLIPQPVLGYRIHPGQTARARLRRLSVELRRKAASGLGEDESQWAERCIRAGRLTNLAYRAYGDFALAKAAAYGWRAIGSAPWMLRSPVTRTWIFPFVLRCTIGTILGRRSVLIWRRCRRVVTGRLRARYFRRERAGERKPRYSSEQTRQI